jgi:hypothetical protein
MANRVDAAMDEVQRASIEPTPDRPSSHSGGKQLMPPDNPMLCLRQLGKQTIRVQFTPGNRMRFTFGPPGGLNVKLVRSGPPSRRLVCHRGDADTALRAGRALNVKSLKHVRARARKRGSNPPLPPLALIP